MLHLLTTIVLLGISSTWADDTLNDTSVSMTIVNGKWADKREFPYQVSIRIDGSHSCGGSIIDAKFILTAAHCVTDSKGHQLPLNKLRILPGTIDVSPWFPTLYRIKKAIVHKDYDLHNVFANDIAILLLEEPIPFDKYQQAIKLPEKDVPVDSTVVLSGWGNLNFPAGWFDQPKYLRKLETNVVSNTFCRNVLHANIVPEQICAFRAKGYGACHGDSGSPLVYNNTVIGLASWVFNGCAKGKPDVYTRVYSFLPWIKNITNTK